MKGRKKGIVIIISFVFLAILSSIGIAFVWFSGLEIEAQKNFISKIRVRFVADSGAEFAITRLQDLAQKRGYDAIYEENGRKNLWSYPLESFDDANINGKYDKGETIYEDYDDPEGKKSYGIPKIVSVREPSFAIRSDKRADKISIGNKELGYSNELEDNGSVFSGYILKVRDAHSMIYINGPMIDTDQARELAPFVVGMLNMLGDLVVYDDGTSFNDRAKKLGKEDKLGNRIKKILSVATNSRIPNKFMLMDKSFLSDDNSNLRFEREEYKLIKDYITTYAWLDTTTINPNVFTPFVDTFGSGDKAPYSMLKTGKTISGKQSSFNFPIFRSASLQIPNSNPLTLFGMCPPVIRGVKCNEPAKGGTPASIKSSKKEEKKDSSTDIVLDTFGSEDEDPPFHKVKDQKFKPEFPDYAFLLQERAPINVNTAPREILIVNFINLYGWYFDTSKFNKTYVNPGRYKETKPITKEQAVRLADHIIAYRRRQPFTNWNQFERFIMGLESADRFDSKYPVSGGLDPKLGFLDDSVDKNFKRQVIFANVNPNTRMGDFNPDATYGAYFTNYVDKSKLLYHTNEFTFSSMGYYEIESLGFIVKRLDKRRVTSETVVPVDLLAQYTLTYDVKLFEVYRHTSQRDFAIESVQWIDGKKQLVKSRAEASYVTSFPENMLNLLEWKVVEGESRLVLPKEARNAASGFDGYLSIAPKEEDKSRYSLFSFYNSFTQSFQPNVAKYSKGEIRGTADEKRSIIDTFKGRGIFPPGRLGIPGFNVNIAHLTRSSMYPDGYFTHETLRYPYRYDNSPDAKYGWSTKGSRSVIDEYLGYPAGLGKEESGIWNIGKIGAIEFWFKPAWDLEEQNDSDRDTRTFFSVGDAEGVWEETTTEMQVVEGGGQPSGLHACAKWEPDYATLAYVRKFSTSVTYGDPAVVQAMRWSYKVAKMVGEEILFPKPEEWSKWLALKAYVEQRKSGGFSPSYAERRSVEAAKRLNEIIYYESDEVKRQYEERYKKTVNFAFPEERLVIFARNQKVAAFVGNNYAEETGIDDFGNFRSAAVRLLKNEWKKGTWHHILMVWTPTSHDDEEVEVALYVNGKRSVNPYKSSMLVRNERNTLFFGTNRFKKATSNAFPLTADGTIADFKIYNNPNDALGSTKARYKDRYWRKDVSEVYWSAVIAQFHEGRYGKLGTVTWTERIPKITGDSLRGGDVLIKVSALNEKLSEDGEYVYPKDNSLLIGSNSGDCKCKNEDGTNANHPDPRLCYSKNGGGFPFIDVTEIYNNAKRSSFDTKQKKWYGFKYYVHFTPPDTGGIVSTPILEDITVTFITEPKILKVHEVQNEIK